MSGLYQEIGNLIAPYWLDPDEGAEKIKMSSLMPQHLKHILIWAEEFPTDAHYQLTSHQEAALLAIYCGAKCPEITQPNAHELSIFGSLMKSNNPSVFQKRAKESLRELTSHVPNVSLSPKLTLILSYIQTAK